MIQTFLDSAGTSDLEPPLDLATRRGPMRAVHGPVESAESGCADSMLGVNGQTTALARRLIDAGRRDRAPVPLILPSEFVTALLVILPPSSARQRNALLAFAVEERIGAPIETVCVAPGPPLPASAPPLSHLAFVISTSVLEEATASLPAGTPIMPDFLAIPTPDAPSGKEMWAIWRDGGRAVVRRSDGTGFAVAMEAFETLWERAQRPSLLSLGDALPTVFNATDISQEPPPPATADLSFSFKRADDRADANFLHRQLVAAAAIALAAAGLHLAIVGADVLALSYVAKTELAAAEAALAPVLPGVAVPREPAPILARLAPTAAELPHSDFLPFLSEVSGVLNAAGPSVTFRRLTWEAENGELSLVVQGRALDDLQAVERALAEAGYAVTSGAASAGDGGAEVQMRVGRSAG